MTSYGQKKRIPKHVAIIMDGNNRWASRDKKPKLAGHAAGVHALRSVITYSRNIGLKYLSVFAFSSENWRRPETEVKGLMTLFREALVNETPKLVSANIRLSIIGDRSAFSSELNDVIATAEAGTANCNGMFLNICANYGGKWDIVSATKKIALSVASGELMIDSIDESIFDANHSFSGQPPVDCLVRTGGERRISNFLLWQVAYAELVFSDTLWPDYNGLAFQNSLDEFNRRERRFGMKSEQMQGIAC